MLKVWHNIILDSCRFNRLVVPRWYGNLVLKDLSSMNFQTLPSVLMVVAFTFESKVRMGRFIHFFFLVESLQKFLSVADLRVDGRNTYQQSQCSPQNNSNSQPEYTRLYLPVSTTLALLPAIRSSICLNPTL